MMIVSVFDLSVRWWLFGFVSRWVRLVVMRFESVLNSVLMEFIMSRSVRRIVVRMSYLGNVLLRRMKKVVLVL